MQEFILRLQLATAHDRVDELEHEVKLLTLERDEARLDADCAHAEVLKHGGRWSLRIVRRQRDELLEHVASLQAELDDERAHPRCLLLPVTVAPVAVHHFHMPPPSAPPVQERIQDVIHQCRQDLGPTHNVD